MITPDMRGESDARADLAAPALIRLMTWLSPAFPTGGFAYSHGLEAAFAEGRLHTADELEVWLDGLLAFGSGWSDAVFCAQAWRAANAGASAEPLAAHCEALCSGLERRLETLAQGSAFLKAADAWQPGLRRLAEADWPLPVAVGFVAGRMAIPLYAAVCAYLSAFHSALLQAAMRLGRIGQQDGVRLQAGAETTILTAAGRAVLADIGSAGSCTVLSEIMAMRHETLPTRIFRS